MHNLGRMVSTLYKNGFLFVSYGWDFGDIVLPQWLVLPRGSNDIVLELFLCSLCSLLTALSIFPFTFGGIPLDV